MSEIVDITTAYSRALVEAGAQHPNLVVLDADIPDSCMTEPFYTAYPGRAFDLGVAEQSLPTFAAGLALVGKIPFYNTFAVFAVHRGLDMIRQSVCYNRANVKIIGHAAGQALGYAGPSHHTLEDLSALRALPNVTILIPSDAEETRQMVHWMAAYDGPVYLRLSRNKVPPIHAPGYRFQPGKSELLRQGKDVSIYTCGDLVAIALEVHERLKTEGVSVQVVNVPTLKPLEAAEILRHGQRTRAALTIEDHNVIGGLGSAVAEIYAEHLQKPLKRLGIPDTFTESDDKEVLLEAYGVSAARAIELIHSLLGNSGK
ncbi:MAG: transketolase family protein [Anaerolineales bacterium]|nr:transketolase family protein [Anaerolineales bacterium]